jgi:protein SCO1/2
VTRILRILAAVLILAPLSAHGATALTAALPGDSVYQLPARLTDATGRVIAWSDLRGKPRVATMFYTSCKYICPLVVDSLRAIERKLPAAERERLGFVLISMDPARDTPEALAKLTAERKLDAARWTLLQPAPEDLRGLAGLLGIRYRSLADGEFNHSTALVLLDAEGRVLARSDRLGADGDPAFLADVRAAAVSGSASGR